MDIRFVQGFVDEINRQKLARKQGIIGPVPGDRRLDQVEAQRGTYRATPASAEAIRRASPVKGSIAPPNRYQLIEEPEFTSYDPSAPNAGVAPATLTPPTEARVGSITPPNRYMSFEEPPFPSYDPSAPNVGIVIPPPPPLAQRPPEEIAPGMAGSTVDPFITEQTTRNIVAASQGQRSGASAAAHVTTASQIQQQMFALQTEQEALLTGESTDDQATYQRSVEIDNELAVLSAQLNEEVSAATSDLGGSAVILQPIMWLLSAPAEAVQGQVGDLGYWYAAQAGDPGAAATIIGFIANSPAGDVLAADGIGVADYIRWIDDHPDQVAVVQRDGYTADDGTHYTGGNALYQYYLDSLNLAQQVVTGAITDPYIATGGAAAVGRGIGRMGINAAAVLEGASAGRYVAPVVRGATRAAQVALETPYNILDRAADATVGGIVGTARGLATGTSQIPEIVGNIVRPGVGITDADGNTVIRARNASGGVFGAVPRPNSAADIPLTAQQAQAVADAEIALRRRNRARTRTEFREGGPPPGRPGPVSPDEGGSPNWGGDQPVPPAEPGSSNVYRTPGPEGAVMIDQGQQPQWIRDRPVPPATTWSPSQALPQGDLPQPPENVRLMNEWNEAQAYGNETGDYSLATILARQIEDLEAEQAAVSAPDMPEPDLAEPVPAARYQTRDDVPMESNDAGTVIRVEPAGDEDIVIRRTSRSGEGNYNYRVFIDGEVYDGPYQDLSLAENSARDYVFRQQRPQGAIVEPVPATAPADPSLIDPDDVTVYQEFPDGTWHPIVDGEDMAAAFPSLYSEAAARQAVRDLDAEAIVPESVAREGQEAYPGIVTMPHVLADGTRVVFVGRSFDDMPVRLRQRRDGTVVIDQATVIRVDPEGNPVIEWLEKDTAFTDFIGRGGANEMEYAVRYLDDIDAQRARTSGSRRTIPPVDPQREIDYMEGVVREMRDEGAPIADIDVPARTPDLFHWRDRPTGNTMVTNIVKREKKYISAGIKDRVDRWFSWFDEITQAREARDIEQARAAGLDPETQRVQTPPGQSVADRAEDEIEFIRTVGEAPPEQKIRATAETQTFAGNLELAAFGSERQSNNARKWFHRRGTTDVPPGFVVDPAYTGPPVATYEDVTDYIDWLHARRQDAIAQGPDLQRFASNAGPDAPSFQQRGARGRAKRRLEQARVREANRRNETKLTSGGVSRAPIISDEERRILGTRIADLGGVNRSDVWDPETRSVKTRARGEGDQRTVAQVYDPVYDAAIASGDTPDAAHIKGMLEVERALSADFGTPETGAIARFFDNWSGWHSQMSRYGDLVKTARSIQGDWIGDMMQMALREGPVTASKMSTMAFGFASRRGSWNDIRAGEIVNEWGYDADAFLTSGRLVKMEQATQGRSAAQRVLAPNFFKIKGKNLDSKYNPGKWYAKGMDAGRAINDTLEIGRRSGAQIFLFDARMLREARDFHRAIGRHKKLAQNPKRGDAGVNITDDDLKATVASIGPRFSPEDARLAFERLARDRGSTPQSAATFGDRIGRDWANVGNTMRKEAKERVNRALFSYEYSNLDVKMRRAIPFHYWATRAVPFYLEAAIRNPALAMAYYDLVAGLAERAEAEGWPQSLRFLAAVWTGPMGYIFFVDPVANLGLIGLTDMLFPYDDGDRQKSGLGRFLDMATGRTGLGVMPWLTWPAAMAGMLGDDTFALDPTATYATRELYGAVVNWAAANGWLGQEPFIYGKPVQEVLSQGREVTSGIAAGMNIPFAQEIRATDPNAYTNQQVRNGMIDLLMQEKGYDSIGQMTPDDWEVVNSQYQTREGNLYADALADQATANLIDRALFGTLVGATPVRQEGMLARQSQDRRQNPAAPATAPGQKPAMAQQYEASMGPNAGNYGRTEGGLALPEYDPYNDYILTEGEKQFMALWQAETGEAYSQGDLEAYRERGELSETLARTTPEAAPYVAAEIGYYNLGPEADQPILNQYYDIALSAAPGRTCVGDQCYEPAEILNMTDDQRWDLAEAWLERRDDTGSARRTLKMRDAWKDAHPEYARYLDWKKEVRDAYGGDVGAYRNDLIADNPNAAVYIEDQARLAREEVGADASPQEYYAELDQRTLNLGAYLAVNGIQRNVGDPQPESTGEAGPVPGPFDPRPAGWAAAEDDSGSDEPGGGAGGTRGGGTDRSREDWAVETIAASEAGVAQANALLTMQLGYPVDIMDLPPPVRDSAMAMLPPGLIPEDAWLYFDFLAWQAHQDLNNGPQDLLSYLAATANGREWRARRTTFSAGGATLVGSTPATVYTGTSGNQDQRTANPYSNYLSGAP